MATSGKNLNAKLFLEGMEVPFIGATVTNSVGQASIAYIDLVPHSSINNIKARTHVLITVRDFNDDKNNYPFVTAWQGEVFGFTFGKTPTSRSFSISCIDNTSYWDNVIAYFFNTQQSLGAGAQDISNTSLDINDASKINTNVIPVTSANASYFIQTLSAGAKGTRPDGTAKDFLDGFVHILQSIGNVNLFYYLSDQRLRISDRVKLFSSGVLNNLLQQDQAIEWFSGQIGKSSGYETLRGVVMDLMSLIFHDAVTVPFPAIIPSPGIANSVIPNAPVNQTIGEFLFKPNLFMLPPPTCNVFFPDEYSSYQFSRNFFQEPTRLIYKPEMPTFQNSQQPVGLLHVYQPDSFSFYMSQGKRPQGKTYPAAVVGPGDVQISSAPGSANANPGFYGDSDPNNGTNNTPNSAATNAGKKREQQFITNEEMLKGVLIAQETMVPASTQFRTSLAATGRQSYSVQIAKYLFYKKRFQGRDLQITSHLKMSVVPGFPVMILDDSDAGQTTIAYCNSVTHRIYATQGGYTNATLSYARSVSEQDQTSNQAGEPLIPPWFNAEIFGTTGKPPTSTISAVNAFGDQIIIPPGLSSFYASLLGAQGSLSINDFTKQPTMLGAATALVTQYQTARSLGTNATHALIDNTTRRQYTLLQQAFSFLGATSPSTDFTKSWIQFNGPRFSGTSGAQDAPQVQLRRAVIQAYRDILKNNRGFRG